MNLLRNHGGWGYSKRLDGNRGALMFMFISVFTANQIMIIISKDDYNIVKHLPGQFLSGDQRTTRYYCFFKLYLCEDVPSLFLIFQGGCLPQAGLTGTAAIGKYQNNEPYFGFVKMKPLLPVGL